MIFSFEVPDELLPSVDAYLNANVRTETDQLTGATNVIRNPGHESPEEFFNFQLSEVLRQIVEKYPTGAIREKMLAAQALRDEIKAGAAARVVKGNG